MNYNIMNDNVKVMKFTIPVGSTKKWWQFWKKEKGLSVSQAKESLAKLISDYKEDINFSNDGSMNRSGYWIPTRETYIEGVDIFSGDTSSNQMNKK